MNEQTNPPVFDIAVTRRLLNTASRYGRLPGAEFVAKLAEQLQAALNDIDGAVARVDRAQTETLRSQRELDAANVENRKMREELIALRTQKVEPAPSPEVPAPAAVAEPAKVRKKPGPKPKAKLVALPDVHQQKAAQ